MNVPTIGSARHGERVWRAEYLFRRGLGRSSSRWCSLRRLGFFRRCLYRPVLRAAPAVVALVVFGNVVLRTASGAYEPSPPRCDRPSGHGLLWLRDEGGGDPKWPEDKKRHPEEHCVPVTCDRLSHKPANEPDEKDDHCLKEKERGWAHGLASCQLLAGHGAKFRWPESSGM
jgi:hypothetical protein